MGFRAWVGCHSNTLEKEKGNKPTIFAKKPYHTQTIKRKLRFEGTLSTVTGRKYTTISTAKQTTIYRILLSFRFISQMYSSIPVLESKCSLTCHSPVNELTYQISVYTSSRSKIDGFTRSKINNDIKQSHCSSRTCLVFFFFFFFSVGI